MGVNLDTDEDQAVLDDPTDEQQDEAAQEDAPADGAADDQGEPAQDAGDGEQAADDGEVVVSIGDDPPPQQDEPEQHAPAWVKELRKQNRELVRKLRQYESGQQAAPAQAAAPVSVGEKPTLAGCDYDADDFEAKLTAWTERKRQADEAQRKQQEEAERAQAHWQQTRQKYEAEKAEFRQKFSRFDEAEEAVKDSLSVAQQSIILHVGKNRAALVAALGSSPGKLKELAATADPLLFAAQIALIEKELKVQPRKTAPLPEKQVRSAVPGAVAGAAHLNKLREQAQRTGDYSAYLAAKRVAGK